MDTVQTTNSFGRFVQTGKIAWIALLPGFGYGVLEATLHGVFPIYGMRIGHDVGILSLIIPCFAAGSLLSQLPIGMLRVRFGRRKVLLFVLFAGLSCFIFTDIFELSIMAYVIF